MNVEPPNSILDIQLNALAISQMFPEHATKEQQDTSLQWLARYGLVANTMLCANVLCQPGPMVIYLNFFYNSLT